MFFVNIALTSQTPRTTVSPSRAVVIINDMNEPECVPTLSFSSETYVGEEFERVAQVCVALSLTLSIPLDFIITATDTGSATA
ncbi:hypothetical protein GBAR_LOCUS28287, partial [Geodia barretti]